MAKTPENSLVAESRRQKQSEAAEQAKAGMAAYEAAAQAEQAKTIRLRALRLAKEAADRETAPPAKATAPKKARTVRRSVSR